MPTIEGFNTDQESDARQFGNVPEPGSVGRAAYEQVHVERARNYAAGRMMDVLDREHRSWRLAYIEREGRDPGPRVYGDDPCAECGRDNRNGTHTALEGSHLDHRYQPHIVEPVYRAHDFNPDTNLCRDCGMSRAHVSLRPEAPCVPSEVVAVFDAEEPTEPQRKPFRHEETAAEFLGMIMVPPTWAQALNVVGEAGEFAEAFRRFTGNARRKSDLDEVRLELADVIISSYCMANMLGFSLDRAVAEKWGIIFTRGFGNQTKTEES